MKPVRKRRAEELATESLRREIVSGRLPQGARLTEMDLAARLEVSRATVRVALQELIREGLIIQVPYTGSMVASLTAEDAWELYTLRASLEGMAAGLAAGNMTERQRRQIESAFDRLQKACAGGNLREIAETDFGFHHLIVTLTGHKRLLEHYRIVEQQVRLTIASANALIIDPIQLVAQHDPIASAILRGDGNEAKLRAEKHNYIEGRRLVEHLKRVEASQEDERVAAV